MHIDLHAAQRPGFAFGIHAQRDRGASAKRRAEELEWPGPASFATKRGRFIGAQLVMAGRYRHRVIGRADRCAYMRHASLQRWISPRRLRLAIYSAAGAACLHSSAFKIGGGRHATRGAHSDYGAMGVAPAELYQRLAEIADARHAVGVPERDRAANHVGLFPRSFELRLIV